MSVYVDQLRQIKAKGEQARRVGTRNGHRWCHMWADTLEELHAMARRIGMKRAWFQDHASLPHYDLTPSRRAKAVSSGAKEVGLREMMQAIEKHRYSECAAPRVVKLRR